MTQTQQQNPPSALEVINCVGNTPMTYESMQLFIKNTAVHPSMAFQLDTMLKRTSVAIGTLSSRAWGVNDFCYRFDRRADKNFRRLVMFVKNTPAQQYPVGELTFELTPDGYIYRISELKICQDNFQFLN